MDKQQDSQQQWERQVLEQMVFASLKEQRRTRRWNIFFRSLFFLYILLFIIALWPSSTTPAGAGKPHAAIVNLFGAIMPNSPNSAHNIIKSLDHAFKDENTLGVILNINSPGGSPVQSAYIYNEILRLRHKYPQKKIYAVCADICASGAYYVASATNDIYANQSSLVGSIGVLISSFGFVDAIHKLGIQRRLLTAGKNKGILDPFSKMTDQQKSFLQTIINQTHQQFIKSVERGRGTRLHHIPGIFSGLVWSGIDAKKIGLIDGFYSTPEVARQRLKTTNMVTYSVHRSFFNRLSDKLGTDFAASFVNQLLSRVSLQQQ